ncbi:hypothetical protein IFM89_029919 [Coptis chinensis]|uniref:Uncharacterized protein n=1 Tax=Coptis chinensis TaxID=261450 RepID=A0A835HHX9_9MAGN|nr:hypothetical protein IFM89_029919 [Coptis chinensis]
MASTFSPPMNTPSPLRSVGSSSLSIRISMKSVVCRSLADQGPSCIFVGPIETAKKESLEALYRQARDAYYSGKPLIVDDMFDRVEARQEDPSQVWALASVWMLLLAFGSLVFLVPVHYIVALAYQDALHSRLFSSGTETALESLAMVNRILFLVVGSIVGYPIASASVGALQRLWRNDLVALKGPCPNCGEEVFAFVRADQSNHAPHRTACHVCECSLEFRPKVEAVTAALESDSIQIELLPLLSETSKPSMITLHSAMNNPLQDPENNGSMVAFTFYDKEEATDVRDRCNATSARFVYVIQMA